ncbi:MAG: Dyp-type peroxidase [Deltaproteobacteria bacterium]|nr:Dyp-type peroxidase [Kofleriaceae bacterium]
MTTTATTIDPRTVPDALEDRDLEQIQALVFRGWARDFKYAAFLFVQLPREYGERGAADHRRARAWLDAVRTDIAWYRGATADRLPVDGGGTVPGRLQLALTTRGLRSLGLAEEAIRLFPYEAKAGMERRARVLGDPLSLEEAKKELVANPDDLDLLEANKPTPTDWSLDLRDCDAMLLLYAGSDADLRAAEAAQRARVKQHGGVPMTTQWSSEWKEREPFGFADGLSQPAIKGQPSRTGVLPSPHNEIAAGEILLGYRNEYGHVPKSPALAGMDLGKNGSFLVFRKLEQDVKGFWETFRALARDWQGVHGVPAGIDEATHWLAARAMGRWTNGNSVALHPEREGARMHDSKINEFVYGDDPDGNKCPIASHVRRANPRDERGGGTNESWKVVKRHRILRRGRAYGVLPDPKAAIEGKLNGDTGATGLLFVCLQANITHGFEFVQQIWNNNPAFNGIYQEPDPIMGPGGGPFSIPAKPARLRTPPLPRFVIPRGGGYFFVPSRAVVDLLAGA